MRRAVASTLFTQVAIAISLFAVNAIAARVLGPADRGTAYLAILVPSLLVLLLTAGITNSVVRFVAPHHEEVGSAMALTNWMTILAALLLGPLLWYGAPAAQVL